ncbi:hypothetical protein GCM10025794_07410 [Massilia kyonggiensis]
MKFGHAVYLPAPNETVQYTVSVSRDSAVWKTVCPIYPNQRLTLIGHDAHEATYAAPGWPFGAEGAVLLINDGPDSPLEVQVRPKDAFDCSYDAAAYGLHRDRAVEQGLHGVLARADAAVADVLQEAGIVDEREIEIGVVVVCRAQAQARGREDIRRHQSSSGSGQRAGSSSSLYITYAST